LVQITNFKLLGRTDLKGYIILYYSIAIYVNQHTSMFFMFGECILLRM
jgi:hypothetical protein